MHPFSDDPSPPVPALSASADDALSTPPTSNATSRTVSGSSTFSSTSFYQHAHSMSTLSDIYPLTSSSLVSTSVSSSDVFSPSSPPAIHSQSPAVTQLMALFRQPSQTSPDHSQDHRQLSQSKQQPQLPKTLRRKNSSRALRKRQSRTQLNPKQSKRQFNHSNLDLLDNNKLTTFPQVYNTFININGQVELSSDPSPGPPKSATIMSHQHQQLHQHLHQHLHHAPALSKDAIVFVEDYFDPDFLGTDSSSSSSAQHAHLQQHRVAKSTSSSSCSLSPFSTMRRGSLVKACVHCKRHLVEFTNTSFSELVCNDCAFLHQQQNNPPLRRTKTKFGNMSTSTLPIMHSSDQQGWYTTVRRKLRWRWRFKGLLPPGVTS